MAARIAPFLVVLLAALASAGPASAAAPANDAFAAAELLTGDSATTTGTNVEATKETGEPNHAGTRGGGSVWFRWVAPSNGVAVISTAGSTFDTVLAAYTGLTVDGLVYVASNDQWNGNTSRIRFATTAGRTYFFAVDGWSNYRGTIALSLAHGAKPANDDFANA